MRSRAFPGRLHHILNQLKINETVLNNEIEFAEEVLQGRVPRTGKYRYYSRMGPWISIEDITIKMIMTPSFFAIMISKEEI